MAQPDAEIVTPHVIRLSGFWTRDELPDGRTRFTRPFGQPRTLDTNESAWLTSAPVPASGTVTVNGVSVGEVHAGQPFEFDVTHLLQPRNRIVIEFVELSSEWDEVIAMEIRQKGDAADAAHFSEKGTHPRQSP